MRRGSEFLRNPGRRRFLVGAGALGAVTLYSGEIERHFLSITDRTVFIRNLPSAFDGFRIAQLSDFHHRHFEEDFFLRHAVREVNRLKPDLVALTGDFITADHEGMPPNLKHADICAALLSELNAPLRFCSLGNHDTIDVAGVTAALERHKLRVLNNANVAIDLKGDRLWVAGLADAYFDVPNLAEAIPKRKEGEPILLLGHEPDFVDTVVQNASVDLMLAGHTHGGQVKLPLLPPMFLPGLGQKYIHGHFQVGSTQLYVNRGLGTVHLPFRFNCPPELTMLTLRPAV